MKKASSLRMSQAFLTVYGVPIVHGWLLLVLILCVLPTSMPQAPVLPHIDKLVHGLMYGVPACVLASIGKINGKWIAYLILFGLMVELIQSVLSYRSGDIYDACANTLGILCGWWLGSIIRNRLRSGQ